MARPDRALAVDAGLTGVLGVVFLASTAGASDARPLDGLGWALLAANVLLLLALRRAPLLVVACLSVAYPAWAALEYPTHLLQSLPTPAAMVVGLLAFFAMFSISGGGPPDAILPEGWPGPPTPCPWRTRSTCSSGAGGPANGTPPAWPCRWRCWWRRRPSPCGDSGTPEPGTPPLRRPRPTAAPIPARGQLVPRLVAVPVVVRCRP